MGVMLNVDFRHESKFRHSEFRLREPVIKPCNFSPESHIFLDEELKHCQTLRRLLKNTMSWLYCRTWRQFICSAIPSIVLLMSRAKHGHTALEYQMIMICFASLAHNPPVLRYFEQFHQTWLHSELIKPYQNVFLLNTLKFPACLLQSLR